MADSPFVWITLHAPFSGGSPGMPPALAEAGPRIAGRVRDFGEKRDLSKPRALENGAEREQGFLLQPGRGDAPFFGTDSEVGFLFGNDRGPHYRDSSAQNDALAYAISELEDVFGLFGDMGPWIPPNGLLLALRLRWGLAWRHHPAESGQNTAPEPTLGEFLRVPAAPGLKRIADAHGACWRDLPFGLLLLDASTHRPSAHARLRSETSARADLALLSARLSALHGENRLQALWNAFP